MSTTKGSIESVGDVLTEAYHLVFDVKDAVTGDDDNDHARDIACYIAYEACQKIVELMRALDLEPPHRFDGNGRPTKKIAAVKIEFPFTEAPATWLGPFEGDDCWAHANRWLRNITPPKLGYYKTDFVVTYEDGNTYEGRYDIGADAPTLDQHMRDHLNYQSGSADQQFLATYQIGPA